VEAQIDHLPEEVEMEELGTPVSMSTPSKLPLRRTNSAFKTHVSERKTGQCKPLSLAKDSGFSSKTLDIMLTDSVPYLPKKDQDSLVFYGTQKFYVFLRFFYTLYERILKAWELCHQFEENNKTRGLS